jgi:hypothetical protein
MVYHYINRYLTTYIHWLIAWTLINHSFTYSQISTRQSVVKDMQACTHSHATSRRKRQCNIHKVHNQGKIQRVTPHMFFVNSQFGHGKAATSAM